MSGVVALHAERRTSETVTVDAPRHPYRPVVHGTSYRSTASAVRAATALPSCSAVIYSDGVLVAMKAAALAFRQCALTRRCFLCTRPVRL